MRFVQQVYTAATGTIVSITMILTINDKPLFVFDEEGLQLPTFLYLLRNDRQCKTVFHISSNQFRMHWVIGRYVSVPKRKGKDPEQVVACDSVCSLPYLHFDQVFVNKTTFT